MIRPAIRLAATAALALALGGCVTIFPKEEPEQLYRFASASAPSSSGQVARYAVLEDAIDFDRMASTDRILTVTGDEVAYIKGGRWAVAAPPPSSPPPHPPWPRHSSAWRNSPPPPPSSR